VTDYLSINEKSFQRKVSGKGRFGKILQRRVSGIDPIRKDKKVFALVDKDA
jgi:hypothetical protein